MLWYEKYRPKTLDDYVWTNNETRKQLEDWIKAPLDYPHLLLVGPTGTGKTTLALMMKSLLEGDIDFKFIPASLRSGVDTIRDEIVGFCESGGFNTKIVILDEIERISIGAQEMLRNVMDRYVGDVRFIFTGNRIDKTHDAVIGRMWTIQVEALDEGQFIDRLGDILDAEGVDVASDASLARLSTIVDENYPNMRKAISAMQMSVVNGVLVDTVDAGIVLPWENELWELFAQFDITRCRRFVTSIRADDFEQVYRVLYNSDAFGSNTDEAILVIADHLYRHSQAGLPDITLCSCLIKLSELDD